MIAINSQVMKIKKRISWLIIIPSERSARLGLRCPILEKRIVRTLGADLSGGNGASNATVPRLIYDKNPLDMQSRDQVIREVQGVELVVLDHASVNPLQ